MQNNTGLIFSLLWLVCMWMTGCQSVTKKESGLTLLRFDSISLGEKKESIEALIGIPTEIRNEKSGDHWIYNNNDELQSQRGSISVNSNTGLVIAKTWIPGEGEPESKLEFLLNKKFMNVNFKKILPGRCGRDYFPSEMYYVNTEKGYLIEYDKRSELVEVITLTSTDLASQIVNKITSCKK